MTERTTAPGTGSVTTQATVRFGSPLVVAAGIPAQARVLLSDQLVPALRTAYIRATPVVIDTGGRLQNTIEVRVIPAVHAAGDRLGPVVTAAALQAAVTARSAATTLNTHARPVTSEAVRRGRNALDALLGSDLTPAPVAVPGRSHGRRLRRGPRWVAAAGAVGGVSYGAWQVWSRRAHTTRPDPADTPVTDPAEVLRIVAEMPEPVVDPAATPVADTVETTADDLDRQPGGVHGAPGSTS